MLLDTLIPSTEKHIAKSASIYVYYSFVVKNFADFFPWNNIVNALTQYVNPKDSAESSEGCRKYRKDIWNNHKKAKKFQTNRKK